MMKYISIANVFFFLLKLLTCNAHAQTSFVCFLLKYLYIPTFEIVLFCSTRSASLVRVCITEIYAAYVIYVHLQLCMVHGAEDPRLVLGEACGKKKLSPILPLICLMLLTASTYIIIFFDLRFQINANLFSLCIFLAWRLICFQLFQLMYYHHQ